MTIPKPTMSIKTVKKMTKSGDMQKGRRMKAEG
jgi:hypothetical protein